MTSQGNTVVNWTTLTIKRIKYTIYRGDRGVTLSLCTAQRHWNAAPFLAPTVREGGKTQEIIQRRNINEGDR